MNPKFEELRVSGGLPSPCGVGMAILNLTRDEDFETDDLVDALQADPALTGRLLNLANCVRAAGVAPIGTIAQATMRLGALSVRNVALGFSLMSGNRTGRCASFDYDAYWSRSLFTAIAAQHIASGVKGAVEGEAFVLGLLSRIGELALASIHPEAYGEILSACDDRDLSGLIDEERRRFEITHLEVTQAMLVDWGLPPQHADAAAAGPLQGRDTTGIDDLKSVLWAASVIAEFYMAGDARRASMFPALERVRECLGLGSEGFDAFGDRLFEDWTVMGQAMDIPTPEHGAFRDLRRRAAVLAEQMRSATARNVSQRDGVSAPGPATPSDEETETGGLLAEEEASSSVRVLAIKDDSNCLESLLCDLGRDGHEVCTAGSGESGLKLAVEWNPQIVIMDSVTAEMAGLDLCRALRRFESGREMYIIILTGDETDETILRAFEAGADDYIMKSSRPRVLAARVRAALRVVRLQECVAADRRKMQAQVAELGVLTRRLEQASLTDSLTGLPNRRFAMAHLAEVWRESDPGNQLFSVIMADIDHFKSVNDEYGHDAGDHVLQGVARTLTTHLRGNEKVFRMGGEEFLIVCRGTGIEGSLGCAERLRQALESTVFRWGDSDRSVTCSFGVAERRSETRTPFELVKAADLGTYAAKAAGRNQVAVVQGTGVPA